MEHDARLHDRGINKLKAWLEQLEQRDDQMRVVSESACASKSWLKLAPRLVRSCRHPFVEVRLKPDVEKLTCSPAEMVDRYMKAIGMAEQPYISIAGRKDGETHVGIIASRIRLVTMAEGEIRPRVVVPKLEEGARMLRHLERDARSEDARLFQPAEAVRGWRSSIDHWKAQMRKTFKGRRECRRGNLCGEVLARREFGRRAVGMVVANPYKYVLTVTTLEAELPKLGEVVEVDFGKAPPNERQTEREGWVVPTR